MKDVFHSARKSKMEIEEVYFWTSSIYQWKKLLKPDKYKIIILECLQHLTTQENLVVYGFVIMPNHVHLIWEMLKENGKEMPYASFQKFTSRSIQKDLAIHHPQALELFYLGKRSRNYRFWQRDALAIKMESKGMLEQKLEYIHLNPLQSHWNLASRPELYPYSSAGFYDKGDAAFPFLTDYRERF